METTAGKTRRGIDPALAALAGVMVAAAALMLALGHGLTFIQDTWSFLLARQGFSADTFLDPHNEHIVVIPVAIEKLLVEVFGMTSALPERLVLTAALLVTAYLLFVYVRRRVGAWPAVIAAALLLFLGPSWSVILWPFEICIVGSVMCGLAMLLVLEREDRRGDLWACLLLSASVLFSSLGLAFIAAAAADVLVGRRKRGLGRVWIAALPALIYLGWYAGWGHTTASHLSLDNVLKSPVYLMNGVASSLDSLLGLSTIDVNDMGEPVWGRPLLIAAIGLVIYGQYRRPGFSPRLWPVAAAAAAYWLLAGFNYFPGREPVAGRYGYAGAVFVLLIAADLLRGVRFSRTALWVGAGVATLAIASNIVAFRNGQDWLENLSTLTKADTAGIEIASRTVDPGFFLSPDVAGTGSLIVINAGEYLEAVDKHGSPAYTPAELAAAPAYARKQADIVLSRALPLATATEEGGYRAPGSAGLAACRTLFLEEEKGAQVELSPGETVVEVPPGPAAELSLGRFADAGQFPVSTAGTPGGAATTLRIPEDRAPEWPWHLRIEGPGEVRVCPAST